MIRILKENTKKFVRDYKARHRAENYEAEYYKEWCRGNKYHLMIYARKHRDYYRANVLGTVINGKHVYIKVKKKPWPGRCELCGKDGRRLAYHHWDDANVALGLWLCSACHIFAGKFDNSETVSRYLNLKRAVREAAFRLGGAAPTLPG